MGTALEQRPGGVAVELLERVGETDVPGAMVHAAFMAALADGYAAVVAADELLAG